MLIDRQLIVATSDSQAAMAHLRAFAQKSTKSEAKKSDGKDGKKKTKDPPAGDRSKLVSPTNAEKVRRRPVGGEEDQALSLDMQAEFRDWLRSDGRIDTTPAAER